ncbi:MAG TPA: PA2778 family cysteine peptidase [Steroidobacteraceae bacterium]|nr:PA2778 family cysteine peptidase [Steroidobacteraceae bacterium]
MAGHAAHRTACLALALSLLLAGCVARGPVMSGKRTELVETPFFPQKKFQCGPAALATVLSGSGAPVTADELSSLLYVPARRGSLQVEMLATPRSFARIALPLPRTPGTLIAELEAGRPVLVLHNYGLPFWPRWHYAVLIGYDPGKDVFVLRSGSKRRQEMRTRRFMIAWHYGGRWAMVVLRPGETAALDDPKSFLEAAADFERAAKPADARATFDAAVHRWPQEPVALVGRGTAAYRLGDLGAAARDYAAALLLDTTQVGARNNLAQTMLDLGCPHRARQLLEGVEVAGVDAPLREALNDTRRTAETRAASIQDSESCRAIP